MSDREHLSDMDAMDEKIDRQRGRIMRLEKQVAELAAALRGLVLVCGSTGDSFEDFEEQAEIFRRETGYMRPGKDVPAASGDDCGHETRQRHFGEWANSKIVAARAALAKVTP